MSAQARVSRVPPRGIGRRTARRRLWFGVRRGPLCEI